MSVVTSQMVHIDADTLQDALMIQLRAQDQNFIVVSQHVGKTPLACRLRMHYINKARQRASQRGGVSSASAGSAQPTTTSNNNGPVVSDPAGSVAENSQSASRQPKGKSTAEEKAEAKEESAGPQEGLDRPMSGYA